MPRQLLALFLNASLLLAVIPLRSIIAAPRAALVAAASSSFGLGNLVVYRVGDGSATTLTGSAAPVFLDEYTPGADPGCT